MKTAPQSDRVKFEERLLGLFGVQQFTAWGAWWLQAYDEDWFAAEKVLAEMEQLKALNRLPHKWGYWMSERFAQEARR
jgi:hypothetical protein